VTILRLFLQVNLGDFKLISQKMISLIIHVLTINLEICKKSLNPIYPQGHWIRL